MNGFDFILAGTLAAATPMLLAALGGLVVERSGVLNPGLGGLMAVGAALAFITVYSYDSHAMGFAVAAFGGAALSMVFAAVVLGFAANQVAAGLAIGELGRSEPFQAGPDHPRRGRKPACRPRHRLSGAKGALCGDWLWRCDGGGCRGLCRDRLHPALGRWHDRGARLDRACAGGIRHMANGPRGVWRAAVRGAVLGRVGSPGRRHRPAVASAGQYPLCRNDPDAGQHLR